MGRVFTWDEISRHRIPEQDSFGAVCEFIRNTIGTSPATVAGAICGSALGGVTVRSDVDCVVIYDPNREDAAYARFRTATKFAHTLHVPLEIIPVSLDEAEGGQHSITRSFAAHLKLSVARGGTVKADPTRLIAEPSADPKTEVELYLRHKGKAIGKWMTKADCLSEPEYHRFLQKVLEVAVHSARKVLHLKLGEFGDDSKGEVVRRFPEVAAGETLELFRKLVAADRAYTRSLQHQLEHPNQPSYQLAIQTVELLAPEALRFVRSIAL